MRRSTPVSLHRSESIRQGELELTAGQDVAAAGVLAEPRVADQVDVAAGEQVLVVEHVEHVGPELDVVRPDRELLAPSSGRRS